MPISNISTLILLYLYSCCSDSFINNNKITGYDLTKPNLTLVLPDTLREISGIAELDSSTVACIQDENGILFIYDIVNNRIKKQISFYADGDYEGIARVNKTIYILRSDGTLFEISDYEAKDFKLTTHLTGIPTNNYEGLCYDSDHDRLLIACKGKIEKGPEHKDKRAIYAFNLKTKSLIKDPLFDLNVQTIKKFAIDQKIKLPTKSKKKGLITEPIIKFTISAIAIHPISKKLYLLSSSDHMIFILDLKGIIEFIEILDSTMFNKAEGITFLENGDLLITNEGQKKKPTLLRFAYKL